MHPIDEDTSAWLCRPTPLEMHKHQCVLLEDELIQTQTMLRKTRANVAGLVQMGGRSPDSVGMTAGVSGSINLNPRDA